MSQDHEDPEQHFRRIASKWKDPRREAERYARQVLDIEQDEQIRRPASELLELAKAPPRTKHDDERLRQLYVTIELLRETTAMRPYASRAKKQQDAIEQRNEVGRAAHDQWRAWDDGLCWDAEHGKESHWARKSKAQRAKKLKTVHNIDQQYTTIAKELASRA